MPCRFVEVLVLEAIFYAAQCLVIMIITRVQL